MSEQRTLQNKKIHSNAEYVRSLRSKNGWWCKGKTDLTFLFLVLGILATGLIILFSASSPYALTYYGDSYYFIKRQAIFAVLGVGIMLVVSKINYHLLKKFAYLIYASSVIMLGVVLIMPEVVPGFKRWLAIGPLTFQPSEIAKFALILVLAFEISKNPDKMSELKFIGRLGIFIGLIFGLVVAESHLSATIIICVISAVIIYSGGIGKKFVIAGGIVAIIGIFCFIGIGVAGYAKDRIAAWVDPWSDPLGVGFQNIQALLAIGSGGITGQGIGQSKQKHWVPEPQNDFIFSIACEELGFFGALLIIIAFALLVWRGMIIAMRSPDRFGSLLSLGIVFQVGLQTVLNMLVVTKTIPNTGISLPFFSYGGTSLVMLLAQMGVVLAISRQARMEKV